MPRSLPFVGTNPTADPVYLVDASTGGLVAGLGPSGSSTAGSAMTANAALADNRVVKASAGNLYALNVVTGASAGYVMVFNAISAPADGAVTPVFCIPVAANTGVQLDFTNGTVPTYFSVGITAVFSTTGPYTKTASATAFIAGKAV